jgi:transcription antitermination factor NusG
MARFKVGDKVIITEGDFKGDRGAIVDKDLIGDEIEVALEKNGKRIKTHEAHVNKIDD